MTPACILLDRTVAFRSHPQETEPFDLGERLLRRMERRGKEDLQVDAATTAEAELPSPEATEASIARYLLAMTPDDHLEEVVEPPEVSCLTMQRPLSSDPIPNHGWDLRNGAVAAAAADKDLVVLRSAATQPTRTTSPTCSSWTSTPPTTHLHCFHLPRSPRSPVSAPSTLTLTGAPATGSSS